MSRRATVLQREDPENADQDYHLVIVFCLVEGSAVWLPGSGKSLENG
jgi:hypothetical protein